MQQTPQSVHSSKTEPSTSKQRRATPIVLKSATPGLRFGKVKFGKDGCGY